MGCGGAVTRGEQMTKDRLVRLGLLYEAASFALVGFWAAFAPRSFLSLIHISEPTRPY